MDNKNDITLDSTSVIISFVVGFVGLLFLLIHYLHLDTFRIDTWIEAFRKATLLSWAKLLLYSSLTVIGAFLLTLIPYKVILAEEGIKLHKMFTEPQTIKWEDITRLEIIEDKRYKSKVSLLIISNQFSTEGWPSKRPSFQVTAHSGIRDKIRSLAERKIIRELADNDSISPDKRSQLGEDVNS
jgi:hypothetical protein